MSSQQRGKGGARRPFRWNPLLGDKNPREPAYLPSPQEIEEAKAELQRGWFIEERLRRLDGMEREPQPPKVYKVVDGAY